MEEETVRRISLIQPGFLSGARSSFRPGFQHRLSRSRNTTFPYSAAEGDTLQKIRPRHRHAVSSLATPSTTTRSPEKRVRNL